jgi:hypothetical protein
MMETFISTSHGGTASPESGVRHYWPRWLMRIKQSWRSADDVPDSVTLLPTYEASERELQRLAKPAFRERIDQVRTEAFTRYVTGGG